MSDGAGIPVDRCTSCHSSFLPRAGPCPRCGAAAVERTSVPAEGTVLAAVELLAPPAGIPAPHRLVLVELAEEVRLLAVAAGPLPGRGDRVVVRSDGARFCLDGRGEGTGRGEGDSPAAGTHRPPFEPPR